jgi:hypothetical protein
MDTEAQLIQSGDWSALRRHYARQSGFAWESAWVHLLQFGDLKSAVESFQKALKDPRFEEAASIMLWRLGQKPVEKLSVLPSSLRLYEAFIEGEFRPFLSYFMSLEGDWETAGSVFERVLNSQKAVQSEELKLLPTQNLSSSAAFFLGQIFSRRLRDSSSAKKFFDIFLKDLWVQRVLMESRRALLDAEMSRRLRHAYAQKDGNTLKRLLKALVAKNKKISTAPVWAKAFDQALQCELSHLTENLLGHSFWKYQEWSPQALFEMKAVAFPEQRRRPDFVERWDAFFRSPQFTELPPMALDPDRLSLWQILVEISPDRLSEALLRFPDEERFLFLWAVRQKNSGEASQSLWPSDESESEVVRKNLLRAFERSSNKLLWFDRLRSSGCSQSFYEYAISQIPIPVSTLLEDLEVRRLKPGNVVREYIRNQLAITAPSDSEAHKLSPAQIQRCLTYLTPAETQYVLLSRYVLIDIPEELLSDDVLDLFWDALPQVGPEARAKWTTAALSHIAKKDRMSLQNRDWRWIERAWTEDAGSLERFSPQIQERLRFPWSNYLEAAALHQNDLLIFTCLPQLPDDRLRSEWTSYLIGRLPADRMRKVISQVRDESLRAALEVKWTENYSDSAQQILDALATQLEATAVLNDKPALIRRMLKVFQTLPESLQLERLSELEVWLEEMRSLGACDGEFLSELGLVADRLGDWGKSWAWILQEWYLSNQKEKILDRFLDSAFRARSIEEAQRIMVDELFQSSKPSPLCFEILDRLLSPTSSFRIKHLRQEFIQKASRLYPLHEKVLQARSQYDYRAYLLWKAFYGEELTDVASPPSWKKRKNYSFWGLIQVQTQPETVRVFVPYLQSLPIKPKPSEAHELLGRAQKIATQGAKNFRVKKKISIHLNSSLKSPLHLHTESQVIELHPLFFQQLDELTVSAIVVGFLQVLVDRDKGLFDGATLMERFFQGMLLSGIPIEKIVRLCTWFAIHESLVPSRILDLEPQELVSQLPFLNQILIFYLSDDFERKRQEDGIPLL